MVHRRGDLWSTLDGSEKWKSVLGFTHWGILAGKTRRSTLWLAAPIANPSRNASLGVGFNNFVQGGSNLLCQVLVEVRNFIQTSKFERLKRSL